MSDEIRVNFNCGGCGEPVTWDEAASDSDVIACKGCGKKIGTLGEIRAAGMAAAKAKLNETIEDAVKDSPWIKFENKF